MSILNTRHIVSTPDTLMGKPRLQGRRIGVHLIVYQKLHQGWSDEELQAAYQLERAEIYAALAYYYDNQEQIEAIIADQIEDDDTGPPASELLKTISSALTTAQAAAALGITERGVRNLIDSGTLPARKLGQQWFIDPADLKRPEVRDRKPGRPSKA